MNSITPARRITSATTAVILLATFAFGAVPASADEVTPPSEIVEPAIFPADADAPDTNPESNDSDSNDSDLSDSDSDDSDSNEPDSDDPDTTEPGDDGDATDPDQGELESFGTDFGMSTFAVVAAPTNVGCTVDRVPVAITAESQLTYETRAGGTKKLTTSGLELEWGSSPTASLNKSAWYYDVVDFPLAELGAPSLGYQLTSGASVGENYAVSVDGAPQGFIVKEPGIPDFWTNFTIPGMSPHPQATYRKAVGTIDDFLAAYWAHDPSHVVTITAIGGSGGSGSVGKGTLKSHSAGCYDLTFALPPAPTTQECPAPNRIPVTITDESMLVYDIRDGGSKTLTTTGLALDWHHANLSLSKVAWYYPVSFPLRELGTPSVNYEHTSGASIGENFTISVDGVWKGNIVREPGIANYWTTFSIPGMSADPQASYRKAIGTIDDFLAAYWADSSSHVVSVIAIGGSGGSGSVGAGVLKGQSAGCYDLTFALTVPTTPSTGTGNSGAGTPGTTTGTTGPAPTAFLQPPVPAASVAPTEDDENAEEDDVQLPTEALPTDDPTTELTSQELIWWPWLVALLGVLGAVGFILFRRRNLSES